MKYPILINLVLGFCLHTFVVDYNGYGWVTQNEQLLKGTGHKMITHGDKQSEALFVPRRTSTIGRVLPVEVETIKATLPQESNGLVDEEGPAVIRGNYLGERLRAQVPPADS